MIEIEKRKKDLISILNVVKTLVIETNLTFNKEGVFIKAIHPSNTCMANIKISPSLFEKYDFEKEITYTVDMEKLFSILVHLKKGVLKMIPSKDVLIFEDEKDKFELNYFVGSKDTREKPTFEQGNQFLIPPQNLFDCISKLLNFNDIGRLKVIDNIVYIFSKSHMVGGKIKLECSIKKSNDEEAYYDLTFIDSIKEIKELFGDVELNYDLNTPMTIKGNNDCINFEFVLASRIE